MGAALLGIMSTPGRKKIQSPQISALRILPRLCSCTQEIRNRSQQWRPGGNQEETRKEGADLRAQPTGSSGQLRRSSINAGPRALEQRPGAQSSCITRQEKQRINHFCSRILQLATQGCRKCWAEIVHGTCRSQKAIPSPQSLLLTSKD
ncbi:hypothetical protein CapIbe_008826 [Capra ibex]